MRVTYDDKEQRYYVVIEIPENATWCNTTDIVEARKLFIDRMTTLFNDAVSKQLKD